MISTRHADRDQLTRQLPSKATRLVFVYAAGPCGSWLSRYLHKKGDNCWVVAPSLMPKKPGERGKTDRRDAMPLARLLRSGALTPVSVPTGEAEALRDLCRARADALWDLKAAQGRLQAFLLQSGHPTGDRLRWPLKSGKNAKHPLLGWALGFMLPRAFPGPLNPSFCL
jgi:transposase